MDRAAELLRKSLPFRGARRIWSIFERKRKYRYAQDIWRYRFGSGSSNDKVFLVVTAGHYLKDAAWTAASWLTNSPAIAGMSLVFSVDGAANHEEMEQIESSFPEARFVTTTQMVYEIEGRYPRLAAFAEDHPLGRKLASIIAFSDLNDIVYSDSDVLLFDTPTEIQTAICGRKAMYLQNPEPAYDQATVQNAFNSGFEVAERVNSGVLYAPVGFLSGEVAELVVPLPRDVDRTSPTWWWIEQTILSVLLRAAQATPLPMERYSCSMQRQWPFEKDIDYSTTCLRHFVSPVRHLMWLKGVPLLKRKFAHKWELKQTRFREEGHTAFAG